MMHPTILTDLETYIPEADITPYATDLLLAIDQHPTPNTLTYTYESTHYTTSTDEYHYTTPNPHSTESGTQTIRLTGQETPHQLQKTLTTHLHNITTLDTDTSHTSLELTIAADSATLHKLHTALDQP